MSDRNEDGTFAEGHRFWELRSKHGRDKIFKTPELMWEAACEYFIWCEEHPLIEIDYRGKDLEKVKLPKMRAFTMQGACHYMDVNKQYFDDFMEGLRGKTDKESANFSLIITRIRETIYQQKFVGSAAGFLNPNIIARDLGLVDKRENENKGSSIIVVPDSLKKKLDKDL